MNPETGLELQFFELDNPLDNRHEARVLLLGGVDAHLPISLPKPSAELSAWFGAHNLRGLALLNAPEGDAETVTALDWIAGIGGDVVSLAGLMGGSLPQIRLASGKIELLGAGTTEAEAFRPAVINIDDVRIGLLAVSERRATGFDGRADILHPMIYDRVRMLQAQCDHVIVFCHAGLPSASLPLPEWRMRYRRFVDAGASIVAGQPPSGVSGWEEYRNGLVFYGLGTLANEREDAGCCSLAVSLALERNGRFRYETRLLERSGDDLQLSGDEAEKQAINQTNALFFDEKAYLAQSTALCRETYDAWKRDTCAPHAPGFGRGLLNALLPQSAEQARREDEANLRALLENESLRLAVMRALAAREAEKSGGNA